MSSPSLLLRLLVALLPLDVVVPATSRSADGLTLTVAATKTRSQGARQLLNVAITHTNRGPAPLTITTGEGCGGMRVTLLVDGQVREVPSPGICDDNYTIVHELAPGKSVTTLTTVVLGNGRHSIAARYDVTKHHWRYHTVPRPWIGSLQAAPVTLDVP